MLVRNSWGKSHNPWIGLIHYHMDRGIATEANVGWLVEHGYRYQIELMTDKSGKLVTGLTWNKVPVDGTMVTHPGVYCLRSNETGWDEEKLWRTYTMLTDLESVFRSLKSELGLRPVYHSTEERSEAPLYHCAGLSGRAGATNETEEKTSTTTGPACAKR